MGYDSGDAYNLGKFVCKKKNLDYTFSNCPHEKLLLSSQKKNTVIWFSDENLENLLDRDFRHHNSIQYTYNGLRI